MVTVRDVARAAGVSISTVSRALSAPEMVAAPTRDRVAAIAAELGYQPNRAAAGLRAGRTGALGLLVPDLANPYFAAVAKGVAERAREHGLGVFVVDSDEDPAVEVEVLRSLAHQTDGVILASPRAVEADREAVGAKPVVVVNQDGPLAVVTDVAAGVRLALEHLRGLGHRRIAYVGGPATSWSDARRRAALGDADVVALGPHHPTVAGGAAAADAVVASGATAAITFNDVVAVGLVRAVRERGLRVPEDLSVVGCDDTFLAALVTPALTSIGTDLREVGRSATELLVGRLTAAPGSGPDDAAPATITLPGTLTVRDSTTTAPPTP
ncbi:transcriptional regulator, LacI family [Xylanimonas cellulosilytica DSM 15894]|uniref:Transcriptional regulator, LacI family n=1 Tax=Xylanimonas cellulosilytica (strain DSM 15894 / JCM 12276 / CECT 5975 / KCTC 9989 / LMG 20990 / NBRC 107835 / XIL07) TaxID=446471 RepID=D1BVE0_XYLCX|nr:LacI family DNA-binding transcriptional regulator [Xylanimonas cellulosilytica]ACZ29411.1 transcriptional regulator, LacI family [Xylanimonas cellulosilytica DSM 15894]